MHYMIIYLGLINFIGILSMWMDKRKARKQSWRISERTLLTIALLGGASGSLFGMYAFHHKTKTLKFKIGVPVILLGQLFLVGMVYSAFPDFLF